MCEILKSRDPNWKFEIKTNGTVMPNEYIQKNFQFNCSPKLANSKNIRAARIKGEVLQTLDKLDSVFKFVVMTPKDLDEIEEDFIKPFGLDVNKIILMPQGVSEKEVNMNMRSVVDYAKEKGYRLMGRLHVPIWGAKRKV